ncbi:MAG: NAD-dependent deacylase [Acidobacteriota bacterium]|nr:NAD-dependent deacylase [Acidobacteriota bacterium]
MKIQNLKIAREKLANSRRLFVLTGAGVSAESGVPTFRGGGTSVVWRGMPFHVLSSARMVEENLPLVWEWFDYRRGIVSECQPNAAHWTLTKWKLSGRFQEFTLVTQNIDGLHHAAGSLEIIELHGNINRARCASCWAPREMSDVPADERPPLCPSCGDVMRPDVVLFGENLPEDALQRAHRQAKSCDVCLVIGTSALVYPAASLPDVAREAGAFIIEINPEETAYSHRCDVSLRGPAGEVLSQLLPFDG